MGERDVILAYLPPAWIGQNIFSVAQAYVTGYCICCPESAETVLQEKSPRLGRSFKTSWQEGILLPLSVN